MQKNLCRLFLISFLFSVILPLEYGFAKSPGTTQHDYHKEELRASTLAMTDAGIVVHESITPALSHGLVKPLWYANADFLGIGLSLVCMTLFIQNKASVPHKLELAQKLLFPSHFFW